MRVRYTATGRAEAQKIFEHIARDNPAAAAAVVIAIKKAIRTLGAFPHIGTATNDPAGSSQSLAPTTI